MSADPLPLAVANERRKGKPGRPREGEVPPGGGTTSKALISQADAAKVQRLLDLDATARYLSVSGWTVRDLENSGVLRRVRIPLPRGGEIRKLLFDRTDLDRLIDAWKESAQ